MSKKVPYKYRLLLTKNKIYQQTVNRYVHYDSALKSYKNMLTENKSSVIYHKEYNNYGGNKGGIQKLNYELLLVKINDDGLDYSIVEDKFKIKEKITTETNKYIILQKNDILVEEDFYVLGYNSHNDRKDIKFILKEFIFSDSENIIDVFNLGNKVIFLINKFKSETLNMVITKNKNEGLRLFNFLRNKIGYVAKNVVFNEITTPKIKTFIYDKIQEHTGWDRLKIRRHNTRP
jgi:hypothetical protein